MQEKWRNYPGMKDDFLEEGVLGGVPDEMFYATEPEVQARVQEIFAHNRRILDHAKALRQGAIDPPCTDALDSMSGKQGN